MTRYVALLRKLNVGGQNIIKMDALRECFERAGFTDVVTYIQSGNVVFGSSIRGSAQLLRTIEDALAERFGYRANAVVRSQRQMQDIVDSAPAGFGRADTRCDVLFLRPPLTAKAALAEVPARAGVDRTFAGPGVVYCSRLAALATKSHLSKLVALPIYQQMTIRNWNTTTKLLALMS